MCDTFIVLPSATVDGSVIFGKNSDREPNEAQLLELLPAADHPVGSRLRCTYIEIPQVRHTRKVLLSRPYWIWGAEMGANEKGVVIGNEAVFTKMPSMKQGGLLGMDLLRLGLERADTAEQALEVITDLMGEFGQGGSGYVDKKLFYHNSYIIADPREAWVLETAGPLWSAMRIRETYSISNGLTIGSEFDLSHPDIIPTARKKGWLKKGQEFHFSHCYSDWFYTTFSACSARRNRSFGLVQGQAGKLDVPGAFSILRDHGTGAYRPDSHAFMNYICAHSANGLSRHATQSTASLVAHLSDNSNTFWATGTAAPCTSLFKPIRLETNELPDMGLLPTGVYNPDALWWKHEVLHRTILVEFPTRNEAIQEEREALEKKTLQSVKRSAPEEFSGIMQKAFAEAKRAEEAWLQRVKSLPVRKKPGGVYRRYWARQNRKAGVSIS